MEKVAVVTGANQGLGFALVETLCRQLGADATVYLTARDERRGRAAVRRLHDRYLAPAFHLLDVTQDESIAACPGLIEAEASRPWFSDMSSAQTPLEAAQDVSLACHSEGPYGELIRHREVLSWR